MEMFGLFRLLFSAGYWKALFRAETWRRTGVSLRRAHKDRRARKQLWSAIVLVLAPFLCLLYLAWVVGMGSVGIGAAAIAFVVYAIVAAYRKRKPQEDGLLKLNLNQAQLQSTELPPVSRDLLHELAELAVLHAVIADRAGSESFVQTKVLPEGIEVITRRRHLDILRELGMYDRLGEEERNLLFLPDGHWSREDISNGSMALEPVRLFRWLLRIDSFLPTVGATLSADYKISTSLVQQPSQVFEASKLVEISDLRIGLQAAEQYFYRCWAEGVHRGFYHAEEQEEAARLKEYAEQLNGKEAEDFLLGASIVSAASDSEVRLAAVLGLRRAQLLGWVRQRIYGEAPKPEKLEVFFLR